MQELDRRVGSLRLLLADLGARRQQLEESRTQVRAQIERVAEFTVRGGMIAHGLAAMADLDERLERAETDLRHIELLCRRAQDELDALLVTRGVADARARLTELEQRRAALLAAEGATPAVGDAAAERAALEAEIAELQATIEAASDAAARALTARGDGGG